MSQVKDLTDKLLRDLSLDEIVYLHIAGRHRESTKDFFILSSLEQIQEAMRSANANVRSMYYGPAMCAFAILDQIGTCYGRISTGAPGTRISIKRALHHFCAINALSAEAQNLYAFRNGQVHDASYVNKDRDGNWYFFRNDEQMGSVVKLPTNSWDGSAHTIGPSTTTLISRSKLIELASNAVREIAKVYWNNRADLNVLVDKPTLIHKYLLWSERPIP